MNRTDEVVIVTGAASGIGLATAETFLRQGASVVAADIDTDSLARLNARWHDSGWHAHTVQVDLSQPGAGTQLVQEALARHDRIDTLVNNAGVMDRFVPVHELDDALWRLVMTVNVEAPLAAIRATLPGMRRAGRGAIVNVASAAALRGGAAGAAYTASKHALLGLTRHVGWHYGPDGIRCVALCPGGVVTGMSADGAHPAGLDRSTAVLATMPNPSSAQDMADIVAFLASPSARAINGSAVLGDAGWLAG